MCGKYIAYFVMKHVQMKKTLKIQIVGGRHLYAEPPIEQPVREVTKIIYLLKVKVFYIRFIKYFPGASFFTGLSLDVKS